MFRIGEFSRIARVTIETLRHYDSVGLLTPAYVDPGSGYRYYSAKQLKTLTRILALKESGFSLEEIARILQDKLTAEEIRGMLMAQLVLTERELQAAQARQEQIIARLKTLELEENMPAYEVTLKPVEAVCMAAIREIVPEVEQMPERCGAMFQHIAQWMVASRLPFGPAVTIYHTEEYTQKNIDTECGFIIPDAAAARVAAEAAPPPAPVVIRTMDSAPCVASTVVTDDFYGKVGGLTPAYHAIARWIEEHGYQVVGPPRELFYGSPEAGDFTAEIQYPVEKAL